MDQDGANHRFLTSGNNIVLMPRISPEGRYIAYLAFRENNTKAQITLYDLQKNREESLGKFEGLTFTPNFSPDGRWLVMSLAKDGTTCIYKMNLATRQLTQLTFPRKTSYGGSIDTSPCFSHNGAEIVFTSDREGEGKEHIYVMRADGTNVRRISFLEGQYSQPEWSKTRGDLIVFTKRYGGAFYICVSHPDGSGERLLTTGYLTESPTWSPNGRIILFKKEVINGKQQAAIEGRVSGYLYQIDLTGRNEKRLPTINQASGPAWSFCVDSSAD
jgi:TolB protein